jgi:hypothetical protein
VSSDLTTSSFNGSVDAIQNTIDGVSELNASSLVELLMQLKMQLIQIHFVELLMQFKM